MLRESSFISAPSNLNDPTYQELADLMVQGVSRKLHGTGYYHLKRRDDELIESVLMSEINFDHLVVLLIFQSNKTTQPE